MHSLSAQPLAEVVLPQSSPNWSLWKFGLVLQCVQIKPVSCIAEEMLTVHICAFVICQQQLNEDVTGNIIGHILALDLEGVHDVKLHHPSSSVATSNQ